MRQIRIAAIAAMFLSGIIGSGLVLAGPKDTAQTQLVGQLIDSRCYVKNGSTGGDHTECAIQCLKDGVPAALLVDGGSEVYYILTPSAGLAEYANRTVRLTGRIDQKAHAIIPTRLELKKGETWIEGKLPKAMM